MPDEIRPTARQRSIRAHGVRVASRQFPVAFLGWLVAYGIADDRWQRGLFALAIGLVQWLDYDIVYRDNGATPPPTVLDYAVGLTIAATCGVGFIGRPWSLAVFSALFAIALVVASSSAARGGPSVDRLADIAAGIVLGAALGLALTVGTALGAGVTLVTAAVLTKAPLAAAPAHAFFPFLAPDKLVGYIVTLAFVASFATLLGRRQAADPWALVRATPFFMGKLAKPLLIGVPIPSVVVLAILYARTPPHNRPAFLAACVPIALQVLTLMVGAMAVVFVIFLGIALGGWAGLRIRPAVDGFARVWPYLRLLMGWPVAGFALGYVVIVVVFASLYRISGTQSPGTTWATYLFYSISTITTIGLGDIHWRTGVAEALIGLEVICGLGWTVFLFPGVVAFFQSEFARIDRERATNEGATNRGRVQRLLHDVLIAGDPAAAYAAIDDLIAPTYVHHGAPGYAHGPVGVKQFRDLLLAAFPDARFAIKETVVEGDAVVIQTIFTGTYARRHVYLDGSARVEVRRTEVRIAGVHIFHVSNGVIMDERESYDVPLALSQLGASPATGPASGTPESSDDANR